MGNKKRIQKKLSKIENRKIFNFTQKIEIAGKRAEDAVDSFRYFLQHMVMTSASIQRAMNRNKSDYKSGGFITSSDKKEVIVGKNFERLAGKNAESEARFYPKQLDLKFEMPDSLKMLEGMLALEKTKNGQTKTVFAGSRDYKDDFGIQASASWIDVFKKIESKKIESKPSFLNFLQDKIRKKS